MSESTLSTSISTGVTLASSTSSYTITSTGTINTSEGWGINGNYNTTILNAGSISAYFYGVQLNDGGAITNAAGGVIQGRFYNGINTSDVPITVDNAGTISGGGVGIELRGSGNTVINSGVIEGPVAAIYFGGSNGTDTLIVKPGSEIYGNINLYSQTETLSIIGEGFAAGDTIGLDILAPPTSQYIPGQYFGPGFTEPGFTKYYPGSAMVSITNSTGQVVETISISFNDPASGALTATLADPACFLGGTRLLTEAGEMLVEAITPGTILQTASGQMLPVRWLGRSVVSTRFADPLRVLPIRIKAGALGENLPVRDLLVSPDHALFISGILIQAGVLVNGVTILRETGVPEMFTYYHVELASHELLIAEGVSVESFVDNVNRMNFVNWAEHEALGITQPIEEMPFPRAKSYRQVPMVMRRMLEERANQPAERQDNTRSETEARRVKSIQMPR